MKTCILALLLALSPGLAFGELRWDRQRVELAPGPVDTFVDATFGFVNAGDEPVTIEKIEPSCGCTTATVPKMTFEAGERSELATRFDITGRRGIQTKSVTVRIKGQRMPVILSLVVSIPNLVTMSSELLIWQEGEAQEPKTITCEATPSLPVRIVKVHSSDPHFEAKIETISDGQRYAITVRPDSTAAPGFAVLTIDTEFKDQKKSLRAYAQVKAPGR